MISTRKLCAAENVGCAKSFLNKLWSLGVQARRRSRFWRRMDGPKLLWKALGMRSVLCDPADSHGLSASYPFETAPGRAARGSSTFCRRRRRRFRFSSGSTRGTKVVQTHTWCRRWWNTGWFSYSPPPLGWLPTSGAPDAPRGLCLCPGARLGAEGERLFCYCSEIQKTNKQKKFKKKKLKIIHFYKEKKNK